jgi:membrane-bound lytic murein transglycosylase A
MRLWTSGIATFLLVALASGCYGIRISIEAPSRPELTRVSRPTYVYGDDLGLDGLRQAASMSIDYLEDFARPANHVLGRDVFSTSQIEASVKRFMAIVESTPPERLARRLSRECRAYTPIRAPRFTAYYEPVLTASRHRDERFRYPLYQKPDELTLVRLANFFPHDHRKIHGAVHSGELLPYLTREEIDRYGRLSGRGLELAWVDDPVALYFLHVQGSGRLRMDRGGEMRVNYAASNGLPYTSIGRYMLDNGMLESGSSGAIRAFLAGNPQLRDDVMFQNRRYIFFREVDLDSHEGPIGSLGVPLVAGRSIATDERYIPPGSVLYIKSKRPVTDELGRLTGWETFSRFAFSHDSGAAIKGPARADIYWGEGEQAGREAGYMSQSGKLVVLMCGVRPGRALEGTVADASGAALTRVAWTDVLARNGAGGAGM